MVVSRDGIGGMRLRERRRLVPDRRCHMLPHQPPTTDETDSLYDEYLAEQRSTNRWIGALTVLIVIVTLIVIGSLLFGGADDAEMTDVTVDVTTQLGAR
jgi:hypothetical protein